MALTADFQGNTLYRWECCSPGRTGDLRTFHMQRHLGGLNQPPDVQQSVRKLPLMPLMITYATRSPSAGAEPVTH